MENSLPIAFIPDRDGVMRSIKFVNCFKYLGMNFSDKWDNSMHKEVTRRIGLAKAAFGLKEATFYKDRQYNPLAKFNSYVRR